MAAGRIFTRGDHRHRVVIGKDTRISGYMIESALVSGFTSVGMDVFQFGPLPTPAVAMLTRTLRADLGVMISASHNAYQDNGIKLFGPDGQKLSDEREREIEKLMNNGIDEHLAPPAKIGRAKRIDDAQARYIEFAKHTFPRHLRLDGLRIVIDCANGAAYKVAPAVLWELGADVIPIGVDARRLQHQSRLRLDRARRDERQGARDAGRFRHRARRRRRPCGDVRRKGPHRRRRSYPRADRPIVAAGRNAHGRRRGRHGDVEYRARAVPRQARPEAGARAGRRPLRHREDARRRLQRGRRTIRPHHPVRFLHHRRRPDRCAPGAGRASPRKSARQVR